jgi:tellurite resistance protein TehA-like permease
MKNLIALICQIVGLFLILAFFFSLANYLFGLHLGMKGAEVPADPRAAVSFLVIGLASGAIAYFLTRRRGDKRVG